MENIIDARGFILRKKANEISDRIGTQFARELSLLSVYNEVNMLEVISIANYICASVSVNMIHSLLDGIKKQMPGQDLSGEYQNIERNLKMSIEFLINDKRKKSDNRGN